MKYELTYIISSDENLQGSEVVAKSIEDAIIQDGGTVLSKDSPSAKNLAYPINKKSSGFLATATFDIDPEKIQTLEGSIKKESKIIRYALLKKKKVQPPKPRREASYGIPKISKKDSSDTSPKEHKEEEKKVELKDIEEQLEKILND